MRENYDCLLKDLDAELLYNFLVINVSKGCVTRAPKGCRYVILSYMWCGINPIYLTRQNYSTLSSELELKED
jgi:hypothetical protein